MESEAVPQAELLAQLVQQQMQAALQPVQEHLHALGQQLTAAQQQAAAAEQAAALAQQAAAAAQAQAAHTATAPLPAHTLAAFSRLEPAKPEVFTGQAQANQVDNSLHQVHH
jgi:hypothetical protein